MLNINDLAKQFGLKINGVLHIGAHRCEEYQIYKDQGVPDNRILWVEANQFLVSEIRDKNPHWIIYNETIYEKDTIVPFLFANDSQCSSILEFDTHLKFNSGIKTIGRGKVNGKTVKSLYRENNIDENIANFLNIDIQGAELYALKGMGDLLKNFDYLYLEVNTEHVYKDCPVMSDIDSYVKTYGFSRVATKLCDGGGQWGDAFYIRLFNKDNLNILL